MGEFQKHINLAKEKLKATIAAYKNKQHTVVGDLATKIYEENIKKNR